MSTHAPLRVAVLGAGTVGGAVVRALLDRPDALAPFDGARLALAAVAEQDLAWAAGRGIPADLLTDAPAHLVADPAIDVVVELIGGDEPARTLVAAALEAGKPVVTANKHLIAHHGPELEAIARQAGAAFRFEAAVGGGIPVLSPLAADLAANTISRVRGIVNGTTNFILTEMAEQGRSYGDVLAEAQANGYAEADPRGDVEGDDAVNKIVILARLAFGTWLDPSMVRAVPPSVRGQGRPGITGVTAAEMAGAAALGLTLKLVATTERTPGGSIDATVLPTAVPARGGLGATGGVLNRIEVDADPVGSVAFAGPGAGGPATSSAILGDLLAIARGGGSTWAGLPPATRASVPAAGDDEHDTLARPWFALLPIAEPDPGTFGVGATLVPVDGGIALRTGPLSLAAVRAAIAPRLPEGLDATLYPVAR